MRKAIGGFENIFFFCATTALFLSSIAAALLRPHLHPHNGRVRYGLDQLPAALLEACLFAALLGLARHFLSRPGRLVDKPTRCYLLAVIAVFCLFWLPALFAGGFDQDDWMLLAAASIRKIIYLHPSYSWYALDSVDGNFRPLGTVLYFGYLFKFFGASPLPYLTGLFLVNLLGCLVPFFIVREMGYSRMAGAAASLLFLSRSLTYEVETWPSALGDALVILLCGLMALMLLKAIRRDSLAALGLHLAAWTCFCLATLAKQSSFAAPLIVALLLLVRPGQPKSGLLVRRVQTALLGLAVYAATAAIPYYHAKMLSQAKSPYPIAFSFDALLRTFAYVTWYFGTFEFPSRIVLLRMLPTAVGVGIVLGVLVLIWRVPRVLGERPRDVVFCLGAAVASISLFVVLSTRGAPYYASMSAFWMSIALAIALTRFGDPSDGRKPARLACFLFSLLLVTGCTDIRLKQTGLLPSGGYTWGTFTSSFDREMYAAIAGQLAAAPQAHTLVLTDMPGYPSHNTCMALLAEPRLQYILTYDSSTKSYFANDLLGRRPKDDFPALHDVNAYNWTVPLEAEEAARLTSRVGVLRLQFHDGKIVAEY